ncbi:MAG: hypothetical protein ACM3OO_13610 [Planctomycetaceae bacterium]
MRGRSPAWWLRAALVLGLASAGIVTTAGPCAACSCAARTPRQVVRDADAAFVGTVVREVPASGTSTVQTFAVSKVYRGRVPARVDVVAAIGPGGGSSCGLLYPSGTPVAVVASAAADGTLTSSACSYLSVAELERVGGAPASPAPFTPTPAASPSALPSASPSSGMPLWQVALLGLLGGVALIGVSFVVGRRRAEQAAVPGPGEDGEPAEPHAEPAKAAEGEPWEGPVR